MTTIRTTPPDVRKTIALIAHDNKKPDLLEWALFNRDTLAAHRLLATRTTGTLLEKELDLPILKLKSAPLGGEQRIGPKISEGEVDAVVYDIPTACNRSTADFLISSPLMAESHHHHEIDRA
jgi:methylglyoxal synthase